MIATEDESPVGLCLLPIFFLLDFGLLGLSAGMINEFGLS